MGETRAIMQTGEYDGPPRIDGRAAENKKKEGGSVFLQTCRS